MIITKTPLRISFAGGGSDLPSFCKIKAGACVNATIDKYVYVLVKKRFDNMYYLKYSENEIADSIDDIKHDFIREALKCLNIDYGVEIINWADIPTIGTGLGSSSSFLVGLLNALHVLEGEILPLEKLAAEACHIEIDMCKKSIGFQDQFAAAFGGLNFMQFYGEPHRTTVEKIQFEDYELRELSKHLMLFYTGLERDSSDILFKQALDMKVDRAAFTRMETNTSIAKQLMEDINDDAYGYLSFGRSIKKNWELKRLYTDISNEFIDEVHSLVMDRGAVGGKITGAGSGGFFMFFVPIDRQAAVFEAVKEYSLKNSRQLRYMPISIDKYGTRVLLNVEEYQWG